MKAEKIRMTYGASVKNNHVGFPLFPFILYIGRAMSEANGNVSREASELVKKFSEFEKTYKGDVRINLEEIRNVKGLIPELLLNNALYLSKKVRGDMTLSKKIHYILLYTFYNGQYKRIRRMLSRQHSGQGIP